MRPIKKSGDVKVMNPSKAAVYKELGISSRMPITHLNSPSVFEANNGMLGSVLKIEGVTFDTERDEILNQYKSTWHRAITALDERFCVYVTVHRHKENTDLSGDFRDDFSRELDRQYHRQFKNCSMYVNDIYLTLIYKGITSGKAGKSLNAFQRLTNKAIKNAREFARIDQMKSLETAIQQLMTSLSLFKPTLLGTRDAETNRSALLNFLGLFPNGGETFDFNQTPYAPAIAKNISETLKAEHRYPHGNIAAYLARKRIFFGKNIQFQGATDEDRNFGAILTVKRYGTETASIMFDTLLHLDCDFICTNSYAIESHDVALHHISRHVIKMENVNDPAVSQREAIEEARDQVASGLISMGYHHNTVLLLAKTQAELQTIIPQALQCYADAGFVGVKETIGQEPAFWAQIPGNVKYIARSSLITSENFVDFAPLHNYRTGFRDGNHLGSAATLLETPSKTPYFFNFHVKGSRDNPAKGHSIMIGGNGCGKTALMCFMDAQLGRYGGDAFFFDRDRGAEIYIRACGGVYSILSPDFPSETSFNPFQLQDSPSNRQLNRELLAQLCKNEGEIELEAEILEQLKQCVDYAYDHLSPGYRTLSNATQILPITFPRWSNLRRWLKSDGHHADGDYAYIFDNVEDHLQLHPKMGFDLTHFMNHEPSHIRTALMMYLCHRIEMSLTGQLVRIYFDEGWQNLSDPYWKRKLQGWLPTLRKKNAFIVISTQSPSTVITSPIRAMMLDNVATQLFFSNPQANREDYIEGFKLSESEFEAIANNAPESRIFLVKQEHDSSLCRLNLGHLPEALSVLSGNTATVRLLDHIREEVGDDPAVWLPIFYERRKELRA